MALPPAFANPNSQDAGALEGYYRINYDVYLNDALFATPSFGLKNASVGVLIVATAPRMRIETDIQEYSSNEGTGAKSSGLVRVRSAVALEQNFEWRPVSSNEVAVKIDDRAAITIDLSEADIRDAKGQRIERFAMSLVVSEASRPE